MPRPFRRYINLRPEEHTKIDVDPQIEELCKKFNIEERIMRRLNDAMVTREATYEKDPRAPASAPVVSCTHSSGFERLR